MLVQNFIDMIVNNCENNLKDGVVNFSYNLTHYRSDEKCQEDGHQVVSDESRISSQPMGTAKSHSILPLLASSSQRKVLQALAALQCNWFLYR